MRQNLRQAKDSLGKRFVAAILWLILGFLLSRTVAFIPSPGEVLSALIRLLGSRSNYVLLLKSWGRVIVGYVFATALAIILAELPAMFDAFFDVPIRILRAVPVAVLALILVFFLPAGSLSLWIPLAVVLPLSYTQAREAKEREGASTRDLPRIYPVGIRRYLRFYYFPQRLPYWRVAMEQSFGLAVKSAIAGELLTLPTPSLGAAIYDAKLYLALDTMLAWTVIVLLFTALWEAMLTGGLYKLQELLRRGVSDRFVESRKLSQLHNPLIQVKDLSFRYGTEQLLENVSFDLLREGRYRLVAPTGQGKSTLLTLLTGLMEPQKGSIAYDEDLQLSIAFQDGRFLPELSVMNQLRAVSPLDLDRLSVLLDACGLHAEDYNKHPGELSGGMQKQLGVARALAVPSHVLILDESFTELDPESKESLIRLVDQESHDKLLVYVTHDEDFPSFAGTVRIEI